MRSAPIIALLVFACVTACQSNQLETGERVRTMTDKRDGQLYPTVGVPGTLWLAYNVSFETPESWCYDNDPKICGEYGRLYSWKSAKENACPAGWHLPSKAEWMDMTDIGYTALTTGSFNAKLGGSRTPAGKYIDRAPLDGDGDGMYWTSSSCGGADSVTMIVFNSHSKRIIVDCDGATGWALSVRCVRMAQ